MLKTILDFVLSVAQLFFRWKGSERKFCTQCGALLRGNRPCSCNHTPTGNCPCRGGGDHDAPPPAQIPCEQAEENPPEGCDDDMPPAGYGLDKLAGWCLFLIAFLSAVSDK